MKSLFQIQFLGECIDHVSIRSKGQSKAKVFSVTNSEGFKLSTDYFSKEVFSKDTSNYKVVERGQFAYNPSRINVGSIDYLKIADSALVSPLYVVFKPKNKILSEYLLRFLKSDWGNLQIRSNTEGAVRDSLKYKGLEKIKIPLPPIEDQKRIASILTRAEKLITRRKESIQLLDELLKSTFLEMFGDPVRNEKGWEKKLCPKIVPKIETGLSYGGVEKNILNENEFGVLKISAITKGYLNPKEFKAVEKERITRKPIFIKKGDFLFSRANTKELVAACCVVDNDYDDLFLPDKLWLLTLDIDLVEPQYLNFLLKNNSYRNIIRKKATGGHDSMLNISMKKFHSLKIPLPPLKDQTKFATIVKKVESIKSRYQQSLTELENLYGSLSQKAFKGELDLSKIPLSEEIDSEGKGTRNVQIQAFQGKVEPEDKAENTENKTLKTVANIALAAGGIYLAKKLYDSLTKKDEQIEDFILTESYLNEIMPKKVLFNMFNDVSGSFYFQDLWEKTSESIISEMPENVSLATGWEDVLYPHIKTELFHLLEEQKLTQYFDEDAKAMALSVNK